MSCAHESGVKPMRASHKSKKTKEMSLESKEWLHQPGWASPRSRRSPLSAAGKPRSATVDASPSPAYLPVTPPVAYSAFPAHIHHDGNRSTGRLNGRSTTLCRHLIAVSKNETQATVNAEPPPPAKTKIGKEGPKSTNVLYSARLGKG